jgi:hypothetical protein
VRAIKSNDELVGFMLRAPKWFSVPNVSHEFYCRQQRKIFCQSSYSSSTLGPMPITMKDRPFYLLLISNLAIATALLMSSGCPPTGALVDRAIEQVMQGQPHKVFESYDMLEALLCGNPVGNAKHEGLIKATMSSDHELVRKFLAYGADIKFNGAAAVGSAIKTNQVDMFMILLENQVLSPELTSDLVVQIPKRYPSANRVKILSKLISSGATGHEYSNLLITATEEDDMDTARLLVTSKDQEGLSISSVDFEASRCMVTAVTDEKLDFLKL